MLRAHGWFDLRDMEREVDGCGGVRDGLSARGNAEASTILVRPGKVHVLCAQIVHTVLPVCTQAPRCLYSVHAFPIHRGTLHLAQIRNVQFSLIE